MDELVRQRHMLIVRGAGLVAIMCAYIIFILRRARERSPRITYGPMVERDIARQSNLRWIYHSDDTHCLEQLKMRRAPFFELCNLFRERQMLRDTIHCYVEEQVAMFLLVVGHNHRFRALPPIFRRSIETISRYFHEVLYAIGELPSLRKLCNLRYLTIHGSLRRDALSCWSPPPLLLRRLHALECPFSKLPDWMAQLDNLRSLEVDVRSLSRDGVQVLATLPSLVHLRLHVDDVPEEGVVICGTAFGNLKEFWFRCKVMCLTFEAGAMPRLDSLRIDCHERGVRHANDVLVGVELLGSLSLFKVDIYELDDFTIVRFCSLKISADHNDEPHVEGPPTWDFSSLEATVRKAISKHPGSPHISIQYW